MSLVTCHSRHSQMSVVLKMADSGPSKSDIESVFQRLRSIPANKVCFDCNAKNPTWSSVTYGVFICLDCSAVHRSLGVHLTFVRSTQLDTNWTWKQLRNMQLGGNSNATQYFRTHGLVTEDARQKYSSRIAQTYKDKLNTLSENAMKTYGTKLHLEATPAETKDIKEKEVDWFAEHAGDEFHDANSNNEHVLTAQVAKNDALSSEARLWGSGAAGDTKGTPSVKKPLAKRSGLGARKGGLGATKVSANFEDIEREAILAEKMKTEKTVGPEPIATMEALEQQAASLRLAYRPPATKPHAERLGIAASLNHADGVSHSATSDMTIIEQEGTEVPRSTLDDLDDFNSVFTMYRNEPNFSRGRGLDSLLNDSPRSNNLSSSWEHIEPEPRKAVHTMFSDDRTTTSPTSPAVNTSYGGTTGYGNSSQRNKPRKPEPVEDDSAVKKFGSAKAISSAQFFGDQDSEQSRDANLSRFQGSASISSAEYFGTRQPAPGFTVGTPDLDDVRESVRVGVTRVAGRLSSLASGVVSSLQERYGH